MTGLQTNEKLIRALTDGAKKELSKRQVDRQRVSFVYGSLDERNDMTRQQVQSALEKHEGRKLTAG